MTQLRDNLYTSIIVTISEIIPDDVTLILNLSNRL